MLEGRTFIRSSFLQAKEIKVQCQKLRSDKCQLAGKTVFSFAKGLNIPRSNADGEVDLLGAQDGLFTRSGVIHRWQVRRVHVEASALKGGHSRVAVEEHPKERYDGSPGGKIQVGSFQGSPSFLQLSQCGRKIR